MSCGCGLMICQENETPPIIAQVEAIFWGMINYMKFHAGDDTELCRANLYGRYWDIPGGDVKIPGGYQESVLLSQVLCLL